jgi:hypothetical protein
MQEYLYPWALRIDAMKAFVDLPGFILQMPL